MEEFIAAPTAMTPHERRQEIAVVFARGVLRLRQAAKAGLSSRRPRTQEKFPDQRGNGLDDGAKTSPYVPAR